MMEYLTISQRQEAGRPPKWISPGKRSATRGMEILAIPDVETRRATSLRGGGAVQPSSGLKGRRVLSIPALRFACTGLFTFKAFRPFTFLTLSINHKLKMETAYCG
jgi:hypothetical protein